MTSVLEEERPAPVREQGPEAPAWPVAFALARVEGARLLRSPLVVAGFTFPVLIFTSSGWVADPGWAPNTAFSLLLPAAMTLLAANLAALRSRRHATEELFRSTPAPPPARTAAHLLAVAGPVVLAVVLLAVGAVVEVVLRQGYARLDLAELAVGPLLVAGAGFLGVVLARWAPSPVAGPVACVAIAAFELALNSPVAVTRGWRWMAFWVEAGDLDLLPPRPARWHLAYLVGLVALAAVAALLRHGLRRRLVVAGGLALGLVVVSAWAQARISPEAWERGNARLADAAAHQVCERRAGVRYCAFPEHRELFDRWEPVVEGVRRRVPAAAWPPALEISERHTPGELQYTPQELQRVLPDLPPPGRPVPDDGALHPGQSWTRDGRSPLSLALGVASRTVGLPLAPAADGAVCDSTGQGRALVALWLAAQATPGTADALRRAAAGDVVEVEGARYVVVAAEALQPAVAWDLPEARHALALLERPPADVAAALEAEWDEVTAAEATTEQVGAALGLPALDPAAAPAARPLRDGEELRVGVACGVGR